MFTIWYRAPNDHARRIDVYGMHTAQLIWDALEKAGYAMVSHRP